MPKVIANNYETHYELEPEACTDALLKFLRSLK
jgi:hypothetical protein